MEARSDPATRVSLMYEPPVPAKCGCRASGCRVVVRRDTYLPAELFRIPQEVRARLPGGSAVMHTICCTARQATRKTFLNSHSFDLDVSRQFATNK
jgi:hypothetical protein